MEASGGLQGADVSLSSCLVDLPQMPCRDGVCSQALIHFSPITDFISDGNRTTQISAAPISSQSFLWNGYSPEPVEVNGTNLQTSFSLKWLVQAGIIIWPFSSDSRWATLHEWTSRKRFRSPHVWKGARSCFRGRSQNLAVFSIFVTSQRAAVQKLYLCNTF